MSNDPNSVDFFPPSPPPGLNFLAAIRPSINMLIIGTAWSSALVPLLIVLLVFSTKELRRTAVFNLNLIAILMGLALGILNYYIEVTAILSPDIIVSNSCFIAFAVFTGMVPLFTESILLLRVLAVYPPKRLGIRKSVAIYLPIALMKTARLINLFLFWHAWFGKLGSGGNPTILSQQAWNKPYQKIEWTVQVFDNGYASALFLFPLNKARNVTGRVNSQRSKGSYTSLVNDLFWIAVSNFVFPVILSLAELIFAYKDTVYLDGAYVLFVNLYVQIIGVLLATVWSAGTKWTSDKYTTSSRNRTDTTYSLSQPRFAVASGTETQDTQVGYYAEPFRVTSTTESSSKGPRLTPEPSEGREMAVTVEKEVNVMTDSIKLEFP